jgi:hypothetical protein
MGHAHFASTSRPSSSRRRSLRFRDRSGDALLPCCAKPLKNADLSAEKRGQTPGYCPRLEEAAAASYR